MHTNLMKWGFFFGFCSFFIERHDNIHKYGCSSYFWMCLLFSGNWTIFYTLEVFSIRTLWMSILFSLCVKLYNGLVYPKCGDVWTKLNGIEHESNCYYAVRSIYAFLFLAIYAHFFEYIASVVQVLYFNNKHTFFYFFFSSGLRSLFLLHFKYILLRFFARWYQ